MELTKSYVQSLFDNLKSGNNQVFFESVLDNVHWTVMGTHPLAGEYHDKEEFLNATFRRLHKFLDGGVKLDVNSIFLDGYVATVEMNSTSKTLHGKPFNNIYCWVVYFNQEGLIEKVRAYVDSALVQSAIDENE